MSPRVEAIIGKWEICIIAVITSMTTIFPVSMILYPPLSTTGTVSPLIWIMMLVTLPFMCIASIILSYMAVTSLMGVKSFALR